MFKKNNTFEKFPSKVWLSSPTMYSDSMKYVMEAYETNWMSTVGANVNEIERQTCEKVGCKYAVALSTGTAALHMAVKLSGEKVYGKSETGKGALYNHKVFCSDMTFDTAKPGLSGLAQVNGRNAITWEDKLEWDQKYIKKVGFTEDVRIVLETVKKAFIKQEGISQDDMATAEDFGDYLLRMGKVSQEEYQQKQKVAKEILIKSRK